MQAEPGDEYIRRISAFIRANEKSLAEAGFSRRRRPQSQSGSDYSAFNPLGWLGLDATSSSTTSKPVVMTIDTHHLFYLLMRLEALGLPIGTLDVRVDSPSRPMNYVNIFPESDKSDTLSLASFRSSFSVVSGLSLGVGWWGRPEPPSLDSELKYIYSSFTKLPALSVAAPGRKIIAELENDSPNENAIPFDAFKNLQSLECIDIDPRTLLGWDLLAESLRSLRVKKSGLEDISDIFIGAVVDDQARREGSTSRKRRRKIPRPSRQASFYSTQLPDSVVEESDETDSTSDLHGDGTTSPQPSTQLSSRKWAFLKHLSLSDNALTFFPTDPIPYLTPLTHLDLSSNLLVSVPPGLGALYNLVSLNLSDNMIDSVLGISLNLGQVLTLNLSRNRLETICGLERLPGLERIDLRENVIDESAEIGRLAALPNITEVWVAGNPFVEIEENYRITCFDYFWKEGRSILLDGTPPAFYEKRNLTVPPPQQMSSSRPVSAAYSPPTVAIGHAHAHAHSHSHIQSPPPNTADTKPSPSTSSNASPHLSPVDVVGVGAKSRRKKNKRIVDLDEEHSDGSSKGASHERTRSVGSNKEKEKAKKVKSRKDRDKSPLKAPIVDTSWGQFGAVLEDEMLTPRARDQPQFVSGGSDRHRTITAPVSNDTISAVPQPRHSRHSRYQTESIPSSNVTAVDVSSFSRDAALASSNQSTSNSSNSPPIPPTFGRSRGSQTFANKSSVRRARVSASVYEPAGSTSDGDAGDNGADGEIQDNADAYRRRIEALKKDMGDGWLKVFSQSQMKTPS